jgi:hypothetical protein
MLHQFYGACVCVGASICVSCIYSRNQWTTFFFIAMWLPLCEILPLLDLVCLGLCLEELSNCLPVSGILEGR